jgi:predicted lipoprotein
MTSGRHSSCRRQRGHPPCRPSSRILRRDPAGAARDHGRRVGLGGTAYLFARGTGRVVAVERSRLLLDLDGTTIALRTGPVFGNTVRDGCGLLDLNRSPGLTEFNAVAAELNRLVEQRVQPALRTAPVGATVGFAGSRRVAGDTSRRTARCS